MCVTLPTCVASTAVCCLSFIGMTISKNTLRNWLKKGKKYLDELKSARFKDTIHQVCMSHAKNKFVKASNQGGELPTDNNLAERTIRKLTTQRNNSLHYGSDAGAGMAAGIMLTWFLAKSHWLPANVKFKTN